MKCRFEVPNVTLFLLICLGLEDACIYNYTTGIDDIEACDSSTVVISFNFSQVDECTMDSYAVFIFFHDGSDRFRDHEQFPPPFLHNGTDICQVQLTLYNVTYEEFRDALLQVQIHTPPHHPKLYCSNNFSIIVNTDPPTSPVSITSLVNCSGAFVMWSASHTSPSCPLLYYQLILNNSNPVILNDSNLVSAESFYYSWSDLSPNTPYSVSIIAVSDAGSSIASNTTFITAIAPVIIMVQNSVLMSSENATLIVNAKVDNVDCPFSYPSHVQYSITCRDDYVQNYTYSISVNTTDGSILQYGELSLPLGLCNCTVVITWYNRVNNSQETINFSTLLVNVNFNASRCEMLSINCSYSHPLPPSHIPLHPLFPSNFGCGITIYNSTTIISKVVSKHNNTDSWLMLSAGLYTILLFGCYNEDCTHNASVCIDYERMLTISECHTSSVTTTMSFSVIPSPGNTNYGNGSDFNLVLWVPIIVTLALVILITVIAVSIIILFFKRRNKTHKENFVQGKSTADNGNDHHSEDKDSDAEVKVEYASNDSGRLSFPRSNRRKLDLIAYFKKKDAWDPSELSIKEPPTSTTAINDETSENDKERNDNDVTHTKPIVLEVAANAQVNTKSNSQIHELNTNATRKEERERENDEDPKDDNMEYGVKPTTASVLEVEADVQQHVSGLEKESKQDNTNNNSQIHELNTNTTNTTTTTTTTEDTQPGFKDVETVKPIAQSSADTNAPQMVIGLMNKTNAAVGSNTPFSPQPLMSYGETGKEERGQSFDETNETGTKQLHENTENEPSTKGIQLTDANTNSFISSYVTNVQPPLPKGAQLAISKPTKRISANTSSTTEEPNVINSKSSDDVTKK